MNRKSKISKIRRWLKQNGMNAQDIGIECSLDKASDEVLDSVLDDMAEDDARDAGRRCEERDSLEAMFDEE